MTIQERLTALDLSSLSGTLRTKLEEALANIEEVGEENLMAAEVKQYELRIGEAEAEITAAATPSPEVDPLEGSDGDGDPPVEGDPPTSDPPKGKKKGRKKGQKNKSKTPTSEGEEAFTALAPELPHLAVYGDGIKGLPMAIQGRLNIWSGWSKKYKAVPTDKLKNTLTQQSATIAELLKKYLDENPDAKKPATPQPPKSTTPLPTPPEPEKAGGGFFGW